MMNKIKIFFATLGVMLLVFVLTLGRNNESLRPMFTMLIQIYLFFTMFVILIGGFFEYIYLVLRYKKLYLIYTNDEKIYVFWRD
mgnify:CR=1 FL=1